MKVMIITCMRRDSSAVWHLVLCKYCANTEDTEQLTDMNSWHMLHSAIVKRSVQKWNTMGKLSGDSNTCSADAICLPLMHFGGALQWV